MMNEQHLLNDLKDYFATHTREEVLKDWEATAEYDAAGITWEEMSQLAQIEKTHNSFL